MSLKFFGWVAALCLSVTALAAEPPKITAYERSQGWRLLFDGKDVSDWRGYRANKISANWSAAGGSLVGTAGSALVSIADYEDFEFMFDWKVAAGGNGAVYFRVSEDEAKPEETGPMMALSGHGDALGGNGISPPDRALPPQFDVWYRAKIVVYGNQVEFWINGDRVMEFMIDSPSWRKALAASRLAGYRDLGQLRKGCFALAGEGVEFRNIKVRRL